MLVVSCVVNVATVYVSPKLAQPRVLWVGVEATIKMLVGYAAAS